MRSIKYTVPKEYSGMKLRLYLKQELKISARLLRILKNDPVGLLLNGAHIRTVDIINEGDVLTVNMNEKGSDISASGFSSLKIVYEDEDLIVIDKPAGLAMHPTHNHQMDTLANMLSAYFAERNQNPVFRAVGRLDKCASGLVLCALNKRAAGVLSDNIHKEYIAVAEGRFEGSGTIDKPVYRPDSGKTFRAVGDKGKRAVTHWSSLATDGKRSVLKIYPKTGRTHQIRAHFAYLGAPLAGDEMYGGSSDAIVSRAALHCSSLAFLHPVTNEKMYFEAELPEDMANLRKAVEKNKK